MKSHYAQHYIDLWNRHWWWQSRRRFVLGLIRQLPTLRSIRQILDVGCGDALFFDDLMEIAPTWGIEPDASLLTEGNPYRDRIEVGSFGRSTSTSRRYDLIVMLDVLEHIEDDGSAVATLYSLLEPGGHVVLTVPALQMLWSAHDEVNCHFRRYSRKQLEQRLIEQGFEIVRMGYFFFWTVAPLIVRRMIRPSQSRPSNEQDYDVPIPPPLVNRALRVISHVDHAIAGRLRLPIGSSLYAVCRRPPSVET